MISHMLNCVCYSFSVAPNIVLAPNMTQNAERKHRTQDTDTANDQFNITCTVVSFPFFGLLTFLHNSGERDGIHEGYSN